MEIFDLANATYEPVRSLRSTGTIYSLLALQICSSHDGADVQATGKTSNEVEYYRRKELPVVLAGTPGHGRPCECLPRR
jgi:hypothetical protein